MYELAADSETGIIYALMIDGDVRVFDAAGPLGDGGGDSIGTEGGPTYVCQLITHDPSPRELGTEGPGDYPQWRERVGLDPPTGKTRRQDCEWFLSCQDCGGGYKGWMGNTDTSKAGELRVHIPSSSHVAFIFGSITALAGTYA